MALPRTPIKRAAGIRKPRTPATKTHFTDADDPKRLIAIDRAIDEVVTRYQRGDLRGAIALGRDVVRQRPDILAAEANLHAASAQVGVAIAARLPSFSVNGSAGGASSAGG